VRHVGRAAALMSRTDGPQPSEPLRAWRVAFSDGSVVYSRGDSIRLRPEYRGWLWIDLVAAPEIFVA
jgi:hypothetical protein